MLYQVPERPTSPYAGSIAELLGRSAEIQAQRLRDVAAIQAQVESQKGQNRGNTIATIGQLGAQTIGGIIGAKQQQKRQKQLDAYLASGNVTIGGLVGHFGLSPQDAAVYMKASTPTPPKLSDHDPTKDLIDASGNTVRPGVAPPPKADPFTLGPDQVRFGPNGEELAHGPVRPEKPKEITYSQPAVQLVDGQRALVRAGSDGKLYDLNLQPIDATRIAPTPDTAKADARFWVMRNGQLIRVSEAEYRPGDQPANIREQGRPVTSGDANKIADFDTSLDDLNKLTDAVQGNHATGTTAAIGAALPNWVTSWTGVGATAKSKQAVIDRVKQVIGKALEGGVLRKEDEYKYEKILPIISDAQEVVGAKLDGLWAAITQRRQTQIDALSDAGYDVTKFQARPPRERKVTDAKPGATDARARARAVLVGANKVSDEAAIDQFLKNNPSFK